MTLRDTLRRVPGLTAANRAVRVTSSALRSRFLAAYPPGGFYSPIPAEEDIPASVPKTARTIPGIDLREQEQLELLDHLACEVPFPTEPRDGFRFHFDNEYYSFFDATVLHAMLRHYRVRRVVEVGSGFSSAAMLDTCDRFLDRGTHFTFIDPYPERLQSLLRPGENAMVLAKRVQDVDLSLFATLQANDLLFVDSSHVVKLGSDVGWLLFEILPRLASGVIVHFHDIPWPFEYPLHWICAGRAWNEAYFLRAFLQYNDRFAILFFNDFMATHHPDAMQARLPTAMGESSYALTLAASSLWLVKR